MTNLATLLTDSAAATGGGETTGALMRRPTGSSGAAAEPSREDEREPAGSVPGRREELQRIRQWAQDNGYNPSTRGRITQSIIDAYNEAQK